MPNGWQKMYQAVRDADGCFAIALSTLLIAAQYAVITDVFSALMRLSQGFRKAHDISHTEVKPLPGNRVQSLRRIAHQHGTMGNSSGGAG